LGKLRVLSGAEICGILRKSGFQEVRHSGSHCIMQLNTKDRGKFTVPVPMHRTVPIGTIVSIIRQSGLPRALFEVS
jgi:predicted RNA binding protein YcfA (HicA-like mRNA interferase family)